MIAGLFFWFNSEASVQILAALAGLQGLFLGIWDLRFASQLKDHPRERRALRILGGLALGLGLLLVMGMEFSSWRALTVLACYFTYIGIHILIIGLYILRHRKGDFHSGKFVKDSVMARMS